MGVACLPLEGSPLLRDFPQSDVTGDILDGKRLTVVGWGKINNFRGSSARFSNTLLKVQVPAVNHQSCAVHFRGLADGQLCAGEVGRDSCNGDSGGPLLMERIGNQRLAFL